MVDNISGRIYLIIHADPNEPEAFQKGMNRLRELRSRLHRPAENLYARLNGVTSIRPTI